VIVCISARGTPPISRIWPMPMIGGLLPLSVVNAMMTCPAVVTKPCMFVFEKLSYAPMLSVALLTPVKRP